MSHFAKRLFGPGEDRWKSHQKLIADVASTGHPAKRYIAVACADARAAMHELSMGFRDGGEVKFDSPLQSPACLAFRPYPRTHLHHDPAPAA